MALQFTPLTAAFGAVVSGISLADALTPDQQSAITDALTQYQVLFFRNQPLTPLQQHTFAKLFGDLHIHPLYPNHGPPIEELMILDSDGDHPPDNDRWHTDVTFIETPPKATILAGKLIPPVGGDTLFSSGIAAYKALSQPFQDFLFGLTAEHSIAKLFTKPRHDTDPEVWKDALAKNPPVVHPVVRTHPESGKKVLFVSEGFVTRIVELTKAESDAVLGFLAQHSTRPEFTLRWKWQQDDIAVWDNQATQHYAVADHIPNRRLMHRAVVLGDKPY